MTSPGGTPLSLRNIIPITGLNPYQNKWTIKARVSSKPAIRTWSNSRGDGKVFNVDLVDTSVSGNAGIHITYHRRKVLSTYGLIAQWNSNVDTIGLAGFHLEKFQGGDNAHYGGREGGTN